MPARLKDIVRAIEKFGGRVEKPNKGSHWKAYSSTNKFYALPCHNGPKQELSDVYIKALCRAFGLDYDAFKKLL